MQKSVEENEQTFKREIGGKHTPYALCLSKKRDNLTHWDRYAANCTGVCIGVNIAALNVLYNRTENYIYGSSLFDIGRTLYTQKTLQEYIRNSTIRLISMLTDASKKAPDTDIGKMIDKLGFVYMAVVFQNIIKFVKNSSFIDEDELRLYYENESISATLKLIKSMAPELDKTVDIDFESSFNKLVEMLEIKEEHFAMSKSGIRSYHNLCLDEVWGSGVIPEIILGPMCVQNRTEFDRFLRSNGLGDTKVSVSKVPIR